MDDERAQELLDLNWNRMSMLTHKQSLTELEQAELDMRISFQNCVACSKDDTDIERVATEIEKTLNPSLVKSIKSFVRSH